VKRRTFLALGTAGAAAVVGGEILFPASSAEAASKLPLPQVGEVFSTIRPRDIIHRPTRIAFLGKDVRKLKIFSPVRGGTARMQNRNSYGFRAHWQEMEPIEVFLTANIGTYAQAKAEAQRHLDALCRIPYRFRKHVHKITIQPGQGVARGGTGEIFSFAKQHSTFNGFQSMMFHEVGHSVERAFTPQQKKLWERATKADQNAAPRFNGALTTYARKNPREGFASAVVPWYSLRKYPGRLTPQQRQFIREQMPNRRRFLNNHFPVK